MMNERSCDICGRSELELQAQNQSDPPLQIDADGLWICKACQKRLSSKPAEQDNKDDWDDELRELVGKSAGAICRTLELPFVPPYQAIIEAASKIAYDQDLYMSAWLFVNQWQDGTTVWRTSDGSAKALVNPEGKVDIQEN